MAEICSDVCKNSGTPVPHVGPQPTGTVQQLQPDTRVYRTGSGTRVCVIAIFDIFGFEVEQTRLFLDELADRVTGTVLMPDYFHGRPWLPEKFPIKDQAEWQTWIAEVADGDRAVQLTVERVVPHARQLVGPDVPLALVGFCYGAWVTALLLGREDNQFACGVGLHPSRQSAELVARIRAPYALFPAENDGDMSSFLDAVPDRQLAAKCRHKIFVGARHGWCTKRVDRSDPDALARVTEANCDTAEFILRVLRDA